MTNDFSHRLIKGKIAEIVFDQMFRTTDVFTIIPFGYETRLPEVAQNVNLVEYKNVLDQIRTSPDFALVSHDKTQVYLVEVKYISILNKDEVLSIAEKIHTKWKVVWLFVATPHGFYFESCAKIIKKQGDIARLSQSCVNLETQKEYLQVLNDFLSK
jgi:hypothetical protein